MDCAVRLLRALHTYAGVDTRQSVSGLLDRWQAVEKIGHSAYDYSVKASLLSPWPLTPILTSLSHTTHDTRRSLWKM